jgi:hypothetical protein
VTQGHAPSRKKESEIMKKQPAFDASRRWICCGFALLLETSLFGQAVDQDPVVMGNWPGYSRSQSSSVTVSGNYAYVVDNGVVVFDISQPTAPQWIATWPYSLIGGWIEKVAIRGRWAWVAAGSGGLVGIDTSQPGQPQRVGAFTGTKEVLDVAIADSHAYLAAGADGLIVVDIADPNQPGLIGQGMTGGYAQGITIMSMCYTTMLVWILSMCPMRPGPSG